MTTLAYRCGVLAADSRVTSSGMIVGKAVKIRKRGPFLFAGCGTWALVIRFIDWCIAGCKGDAPNMFVEHNDSTACGFIFMPDGRIMVFEPSGTSMTDCEYFAEGSGRDIAFGALGFGATAYEAIEIAMKHDIHSGGDIQVLTHA